MAKEISDLALAAFLSAVGHKFNAIRPNGRKFTFIFDRSQKLESDILAFYNRTAKVDPLTYAETFRNFKALTFQN
jgi:hypothetical protein